MPTAHTVQSTVLAAVRAAVADVTSVNVKAAIGWPTNQVLSKNVQGQGSSESTNTAIISVFDTQMTRNTTRWNPLPLSVVVVEATLTSSLSLANVPAGGSAVLTLGGSVTPGDAVSLIALNPNRAPGATVVQGGATDTTETLAAAMAAAINADPILSAGIEATASNSEVALNLLSSAGPLALQSFTGNGGVQTTEIGRKSRRLQITIWTPTENVRELVGDPIEQALAALEDGFGFIFADGSMGRVMTESDFYSDKSTLQSTYRRDFFITVEYGVTTADQLYSVLAPVAQYQNN